MVFIIPKRTNGLDKKEENLTMIRVHVITLYIFYNCNKKYKIWVEQFNAMQIFIKALVYKKKINRQVYFKLQQFIIDTIDIIIS